MDYITLSLNGQPREFARGLSVSQLLQQLELQGKRLAIEHNGDILPRSQFDSVLLQHGDSLEIVVAVGGG